jgi:hypothetical protein
MAVILLYAVDAAHAIDSLIGLFSTKKCEMHAKSVNIIKINKKEWLAWGGDKMMTLIGQVNSGK